MENEIYQILKKHKLPLKKREEVLADLLLLFSVVGRSKQLVCPICEQKKELLNNLYCQDCNNGLSSGLGLTN
jgi:hypothetical protein